MMSVNGTAETVPFRKQIFAPQQALQIPPSLRMKAFIFCVEH
jgi:hypothetical protein